MPTSVRLPRRTFLFVIGILVVIAVGIAALIRLPRATIHVTPATHERTVTQEITLSSSASEPDFVRFILPTKVVEQEATETKTVTRSGTTIRDDFARGEVTLRNDQAEEQRLLPKSHLRHEATGVYFLTDTAVTIPPQGEIKVSVTAKEQGVSGNVAPGKFIVDRLPVSVQQVVYGNSTTPSSGGTAVDQPLSEEELRQAQTAVKAAAEQRVRGQLTTAAGGASIRPDLVALETVNEQSSATPGSLATEYTVTTTLKARAFVADETDLLSLTLLALRSSPRQDEEFVTYQPDSFKLAIVRSDFSRGEARVTGTLAGNFSQKTGATLFEVSNLAGRTREEVVEYFKQFPSVSQVEVDFWPFWVTTVPTRTSATEVVIKSTPVP